MNRFLFIFSFSILLFSCKKPPITVSDQAPTQEYTDFKIDEVDFVYFTSKAKIYYKDKNNDLKANGHIRMKKDSIIWISVNAAAGFEAMRVLINKDSIHILDRLKNSYSVYDFETLSKQLNVALTFQSTQAMILGNLMLQREKSDKISKPDSSHYLLNQLSGKLSINNFVNISNSKIEKVDITEASNQFSIKYSNFVMLGLFLFPAENEINISYQDANSFQTTIKVEHNKPECPDKELNFPFNVPNKFNRK